MRIHELVRCLRDYGWSGSSFLVVMSPHMAKDFGTSAGVCWACAQNHKHVTTVQPSTHWIWWFRVVTTVTTWIVKLRTL